MVIFGFLLGLFVGLLLLGWYYIQLNARLKRLTRKLQPEMLKLSFSPTSRLTRAIAAYVYDQQVLHQQLEVWSQVLQAAPIGFLQIDEENRLIRCNPKACETLHIQLSPLAPPRLLLELVRSYELDQLIEQTRQSGQPCQREWTFHPTSPDPSLLSQQVSYPLRAYSISLPKAQVGVFLENRQEAVSLAQQRDRWISDVAHELKTPLTSIRLVAETLRLRLEQPHRDWLDRLLNETIRLSSLVQELLDLSQLEARPVPRLRFQTVDLNSLVQSAWMGLEPLARRKQLCLRYVGPEQIQIRADESRLHRAVLNLLDNSIKYSPPHKEIQVKVRCEETSPTSRRILLEVIDSGPGFPESALPHIFERFYRADPSRTRHQPALPSLSPTSSTAERNPSLSNSTETVPVESQTPLPTSSGSGLGLAIVQQIVEAHGGSITASNHPETHGAWIQIFLPAIDPLNVS